MTARQTQGANKQPQRRAAVRHHVLLPAVAGQTFTLHRLPDLESAADDRSSKQPPGLRSATLPVSCERRAGIPDCPHLTPAPQLPCCGPACLKLPAIRIRACCILSGTPVPGRCVSSNSWREARYNRREATSPPHSSSSVLSLMPGCWAWFAVTY